MLGKRIGRKELKNEGKELQRRLQRGFEEKTLTGSEQALTHSILSAPKQSDYSGCIFCPKISNGQRRTKERLSEFN